MAILQVHNGSTPAEQVKLDGPRAVLGRHPDCDVVLDAAAVSRQHAQIIRDGEEFFVEDLHSRNGTFVNGQLIQGRQALKDGDRLKICDLAFTFFQNEPSSQFRRAMQAEAGGGSSVALLVDDELSSGNSTIMSKLDVSSGRAGVRLTVNPEMKLRALIEMSTAMSKALSLDAVLGKILDSVFKIFLQADRGFILLRATPEGPLVPKAIKHRRQTDDTIRISRTIVNQVMASREAILSADAASDTRFETSQSIADLRIRSVMCAPLIDNEGKSLGVLQVDTVDQRHRFQQDDLDVLASIASQASVAVDNAQLHEQALKQNALNRDLEIAHKVQRGLLPAHPPNIEGYHFFDFYEPANQVGGDYYDYIELPGGRLAVVLGDVSGKGVSAALLMAKLSGEVRFCLVSERTPADAMNRMNVMFCRSGWDDRFVTFIMAVLNPVQHEVTIVNAGHMPPLLRRSTGGVESVGAPESGVPLGIDCDFQYMQFTRSLAPGDFLTMFTDGISEAMNPAGELYGLARLRKEVGAETASVTELGRHILADVKRHVSGRAQSDDMCLACFGRGND